MVEQKKTASSGAMDDVTGYFGPGERKLLYNTARTTRDGILIRLLWISGRRISEVLGVRVLDISFEMNKIAFKILKKHRDVPYKRWKSIDVFTAGILKDYIQEKNLKPEDFLFPSPSNPLKHLSRQRAYDILRSTAKKCGLERIGNSKIHPHIFRHTWAINYIRKAKTANDIRKLQRHLEHSSVAQTEIYLQFMEDEDEDIEDYIGD